MHYCRYCLNPYPIEEMYASRTCRNCHKGHVKQGNKRVKRNQSSRRSRKKHAIVNYFLKARILHKPFPGDEQELTRLIRHVISANRYKKRLLSLDHIVPINHPLVSGLTVSWNLQVLLSIENTSKANKCDLEEQADWLMKWAKDRGL
jgi:hypothetical protein